MKKLWCTTSYCLIWLLPLGFETRIGYIDVKSSPVYFFVKKKADHHILNNPIPFEIEKTNIGSAIDTETGLFTAPKPGIYNFVFSSIRYNLGEETMIYLQRNGKSIAFGYASGNVFKGGLTMALVSTLKLEKGDRVSLVLTIGSLPALSFSTNFIGFLVEEDIFI